MAGEVTAIRLAELCELCESSGTMRLPVRLDSRRCRALGLCFVGFLLATQACTQNTDVEFGSVDGSVGSSGTTPAASGGPASSSGAPSGEGGSGQAGPAAQPARA